MKKFIIISLSLFGFYACQVTEEMNTGNDLDSMRLECMLTSDDSDPVHYLYLDRFYAIKEGQYYSVGHHVNAKQLDCTLETIRTEII